MHALSVVGYDTDDEYEDSQIRYTRRNKGKRYTQLPKDESHDPSSQSQYGDSDSSHLRVDSVSMYGDSNSYTFAQDSHSDRRNSESLGSSEEFCSDSEVPSKQTYIQRPKEGGIVSPHQPPVIVSFKCMRMNPPALIIDT